MTATGRFELREHTADVAVAATGPTFGAAAAAVADGLAAAMCDDVPAAVGDRHDLAVRSENREALVFDYLDDLIYRRDVDSVLPVDNEATVDADGDWVLAGSFRGVPLDRVSAREIKAVTYSEMRVDETAEGWEVYVVFDV